MMAKFRKIFIFSFLILTISVNALSQPGTAEDPIISKSYAEKFFQWRKVSLEEGQTIEITSLTTFVLYSGEYSGKDKATKIINLTEGKEITDIGKIKRNHLLLLVDDNPLVLKAKKPSILLVKGKFRVE